MAVNSIIIAIAFILATLNINHALDEHGDIIRVEESVTSGLIS